MNETWFVSGKVIRGYANVLHLIEIVWAGMLRMLNMMHIILIFTRFPTEFISNKTGISFYDTYYFVVVHVFVLKHRENAVGVCVTTYRSKNCITYNNLLDPDMYQSSFVGCTLFRTI